MAIKVTLDLLAPGLREQWLSIPLDPATPELGWAEILVKELPKKEWDMLWASLRQTETARYQAEKEGTDPGRIADLKAQERETHRKILRACVKDHKRPDFPLVVAVVPPEDPAYFAQTQALLRAGLTPEEVHAALLSGEAFAPFLRDSGGVISEATLSLYERLAPEHRFVMWLSSSIASYQHGKLVTAADYWRREKVAEERIPDFFPRPKKQTTESP